MYEGVDQRKEANVLASRKLETIREWDTLSGAQSNFSIMKRTLGVTVSGYEGVKSSG